MNNIVGYVGLVKLITDGYSKTLVWVKDEDGFIYRTPEELRDEIASNGGLGENVRAYALPVYANYDGLEEL